MKGLPSQGNFYNDAIGFRPNRFVTAAQKGNKNWTRIHDSAGKIAASIIHNCLVITFECTPLKAKFKGKFNASYTAKLYMRVKHKTHSILSLQTHGAFKCIFAIPKHDKLQKFSEICLIHALSIIFVVGRNDFQVV